jgi:hypothetical protein
VFNGKTEPYNAISLRIGGYIGKIDKTKYMRGMSKQQ